MDFLFAGIGGGAGTGVETGTGTGTGLGADTGTGTGVVIGPDTGCGFALAPGVAVVAVTPAIAVVIIAPTLLLLVSVVLAVPAAPDRSTAPPTLPADKVAAVLVMPPDVPPAAPPEPPPQAASGSDKAIDTTKKEHALFARCLPNSFNTRIGGDSFAAAQVGNMTPHFQKTRGQFFAERNVRDVCGAANCYGFATGKARIIRSVHGETP